MKRETKFKQTEIGMIPEDWERRSDFIKSLNEFLLKESFILNNSLNERTISHKLAEYLQKNFSDYNIDCEYSKMPDPELSKNFIEKRLKLIPEDLQSDDYLGTTVYPDIIIHRRGDNNKNYLIIEIKKKSYADRNYDGNTILPDGCTTWRCFDLYKIQKYMKELKYSYGLYIEFDRNKISRMKFY